jgi:hypothetical protein
MGSFGGKVIDSSTVAQLAVHKRAGSLQRIERATCGGLIVIGARVRLDLFEDRSSRQVLTMTLGDNGAHRATGPGDAEALAMEGIEECLWGNMHQDLP